MNLLEEYYKSHDSSVKPATINTDSSSPTKEGEKENEENK
jgi:hypothetical protein